MDRILTIKKPYSLKAVSPSDSLLIKNFLWDIFFFFLSIKKMAQSKEHPNKTHWKLQKRKKEKKKPNWIYKGWIYKGNKMCMKESLKKEKVGKILQF